MGAYNQYFVLPSVPRERAPDVGRMLADGLLSDGILATPGPQDPIPTNNPKLICENAEWTGYFDGPRSEALSGAAPRSVSPSLYDWFLVTGPYMSGAIELIDIPHATCPACKTRQSDTSFLTTAYVSMYETGDKPALACPTCGTEIETQDWITDAPLSLSYLSLLYPGDAPTHDRSSYDRWMSGIAAAAERATGYPCYGWTTKL